MTNFEVAYVVYEKEHNSLPLFIGFILTLKEPFAKRKERGGLLVPLPQLSQLVEDTNGSFFRYEIFCKNLNIL